MKKVTFYPEIPKGYMPRDPKLLPKQIKAITKNWLVFGRNCYSDKFRLDYRTCVELVKNDRFPTIDLHFLIEQYNGLWFVDVCGNKAVLTNAQGNCVFVEDFEIPEEIDVPEMFDFACEIDNEPPCTTVEVKACKGRLQIGENKGLIACNMLLYGKVYPNELPQGAKTLGFTEDCLFFGCEKSIKVVGYESLPLPQ